jgi:hypothetical protein
MQRRDMTVPCTQPGRAMRVGRASCTMAAPVAGSTFPVGMLRKQDAMIRSLHADD